MTSSFHADGELGIHGLLIGDQTGRHRYFHQLTEEGKREARASKVLITTAIRGPTQVGL